MGETAEFGGLLGYAPVMPVNTFSCRRFVTRAEEFRRQSTALRLRLSGLRQTDGGQSDEDFLIRHGRQCSKLCNVDVDLSEEGYRQASLLGERLFHENIQVVYSSNLLRAVETAQAANLYWNVEHIIRPELREISFGHMEGMEDRDIAVKYRDFKAQQALMEEDLPYPGGECAGDVVRRAQPVFREMTESGYERVAVVTHGGVIRSMTAPLSGNSHE